MPSDHGLRFDFVSIELCQERGISLRELAVDPQTRVGPATNPFAVVQIRGRRRAVAHVRFVVAAAGAQSTGPSFAAIGLVRDVVLFEKLDLRLAIDAVAYGAELVRVRP